MANPIMESGKGVTVETPGDRDVVVTRIFDAPRDLVFDCFTKPDLVPRWLLGPPGWTMPVCTIDFRVGGKYRYEWRSAAGKTMAVSGTFRELAPPARIVHSERFDEDWTGGEALVTTVFTENAGKTTVVMTIRFASAEARAGAVATGMTRGMAQSYDRLDDLLASGAG